jgi:hypothetical protein
MDHQEQENIAIAATVASAAAVSAPAPAFLKEAAAARGVAAAAAAAATEATAQAESTVKIVQIPEVIELSGLARTLYDKLYKSNSDEAQVVISRILDTLLRIKGNALGFDNSHVAALSERLYRVFRSMGRVLGTPVTVTMSDGKKQEVVTTTLLKHLEAVEQINCHNEMRNNKEKTGKELYTCDFHKEDLFTHLFLVAIISMSRACLQNSDEGHDAFLMILGLTALLHDIGKPGCIALIPKKKWLSYPFHGEMGAGLLARIWTPAFGISQNVWETICRTISVHMCGYHECDHTSSETQYKWDLLSHEPDEVKKMLTYLSVGDYFGGIKGASVQQDVDAYLASRPRFNEHIMRPFDSNFLTKYNLTGIMIVIRGMSGSGKSRCVSLLAEQFQKLNAPFRYLERDAVMAMTVREFLKEEPVMAKPVGDEYARIYKVYDANKKDLNSKVNDKLKELILEGAIKGEIVIIDTLMSYYRSFEELFSKQLRQMFIMAVDVVRNTPLIQADADRMGITLETQIGISQDKDLLSWLPQSITRGRGSDLNMVTSVSCARSFANIQHSSRPRMVSVVAWNEHGSMGYESMLARTLDFVKMPRGKFVTK